MAAFSSSASRTTSANETRRDAAIARSLSTVTSSAITVVRITASLYNHLCQPRRHREQTALSPCADSLCFACGLLVGYGRLGTWDHGEDDERGAVRSIPETEWHPQSRSTAGPKRSRSPACSPARIWPEDRIWSGRLTMKSEADLARFYRDTRERLSDLVLGLDSDQLGTAVPACPGWSVSDVMYHLLAVAEDVMAGRLTGPPTDADTAAHVRPHRGKPVSSVAKTWGELAPPFEELIGSAAVWPAVLDVASHRQDIRGALDRPGAPDRDVVRLGAEWLISMMQPSVPVRVVCEDFEAQVGPRTLNNRNCCCTRPALTPSAGGSGGGAARRSGTSTGPGPHAGDRRVVHPRSIADGHYRVGLRITGRGAAPSADRFVTLAPPRRPRHAPSDGAHHWNQDHVGDEDEPKRLLIKHSYRALRSLWLWKALIARQELALQVFSQSYICRIVCSHGVA